MFNLLRSLYFLCALILICGCSAITKTSVPQPLRCVPSAHRGEHSSAPDNSFAAIRSAVHRSIPYIELDIRPTSGGELVLFHDKRLSSENSLAPHELHGRTISSLTREERTRVRNPDGSPLVTLSEALTLVHGSRSILQLDVKPDTSEILERILAVVKSDPSKMLNLVIQCQHSTCVKYLNQNSPSLHVLARVFSREEFNEALLHSPYFIQVDESFLTEEMITVAHACKTRILVKTLGTPPDTFETWSRLCALGIDAILTDYPLLFTQMINN
jgi:glycerophosphoryl diester phosphodiesterase